jgi:hypothetical protein
MSGLSRGGGRGTSPRLKNVYAVSHTPRWLEESVGGLGAFHSHQQNVLPSMTSRSASRALVYSQVDKEIAREVAAMRQILRKQQELLPSLTMPLE